MSASDARPAVMTGRLARRWRWVELGVVAGLAVDLGWRGIRDESGRTVPSGALHAVLDHVPEGALVTGSVVAVHAVERMLGLLPGLPVVGVEGLPPVGVGAHVAVPSGLRATRSSP